MSDKLPAYMKHASGKAFSFPSVKPKQKPGPKKTRNDHDGDEMPKARPRKRK